MTTARLVMPAIRWKPDSGFDHEAGSVEAALRLGVGGFIVFGGTRDAVAALTARLRREAGRPLLISADLERGAGQQVGGLTAVPPPAALAALGGVEPAWNAGYLTAAEARSVGINWLLGPVADLDLAAENPIVQTRSFGADPAAVAGHVAAWIGGAHRGGALVCVKHFPGHGRTTLDSHDRTPTVAASARDLDGADLVPFRAALAAGADAVMTCHVAFPALDPSGLPATRSAAIIDLLRTTLGFDGLVVTDALIMAGFAPAAGAAAAARASFRAGVDIMLYPPDLAATVQALDAEAAEPDGARRIAAAISRYERALERGDALGSPGVIDPTVAFRMGARLIAEAAPRLTLRPPLELILADDDQDGAFPPSPNDYLQAALQAAGVSLGPGGSRILLAFAEPRASKGRAGFGPRCRAIFEGPGRSADVAVLFGHPRLQAALPAGVPLLQAWHRQRLMQESVAAWLTGAMV